ncbi:hypothetical protein PRZ48_006081 [Zasmidium cellare]|uniref:TMEM205-like domain-containing protein n=1 Tax=Zasmidium cellare TaxID=395010 RepID=A0ABR0EMF4_ZASCE|nr:hypothetical protein PRZ48_006081 [Zasmidium cellare]
MADQSNTIKALHILAYGTVFGSNMHQTLLNGPMGLRVLPRAQFSHFQQNIFPPYFAIQSLLPAFLLWTLPKFKADRKSVVALGTSFGLAVLNLVFVGPRTIRVLRKRTHQETKDKTRWDAPGPKSEDMKRLNWSFAVWHWFSFWMNNVGLVTLGWYGTLLAKGLLGQGIVKVFGTIY